MVLNPDFKEFLKSLNDNQVRYLVTGGHAVAFHGYPRYTKDLDIWIEQDRDNARRMVTALEQFGFASLGLTDEDFLDPGVIIQLGNPPNRIDLLMTITGVEFDSCFESRIVILVDDVEINFIDLENLRKNKQAVGRPQDLADLDNLK
jgi:predicted nucleotidyltransferase